MLHSFRKSEVSLYSAVARSVCTESFIFIDGGVDV